MNEGKIGKTQPDIRSMSHLFFRRHKQTLEKKATEQENENK